MKPSEAIKFNRPLWQHQADTLDRFAYEKEAALLHEMGTGKTTSAIAWLRAKYNVSKAVLPSLVISPVATLYNWVAEFKRNSPEGVSKTVCVLEGSEIERIGQVGNIESKIFITNPEAMNMAKLVTRLAQRGLQCVVIDEAHKFKNFKSKRLRSLLSITDVVPNRMILTGTPILNSYLDIWALWRILDRGDTFGDNFFSFRERFFTDANMRWKGRTNYFPNYIPKKGSDKAVAQLIDSKASRLTKLECLNLPPLLYVTKDVSLSDEQRRLYQGLEKDLVAEVRAGTCVASNALTRVLRMLQILSGYVQIETRENQSVSQPLRDNPRLDLLREDLEELTPNHKVIVWCTFQENYKAIQAVCDELKIKAVDLTGQTKDRQASIDAFQNDESVRVMISNPQAGGVGVNLTAASYAIYYSRSYSLGDRLQSEARNHRGGSEIHEKITLIDYVAKGTLDEDVLAALLRKENFSDNVLDRLQRKC